jgi:hypothetical protein
MLFCQQSPRNRLIVVKRQYANIFVIIYLIFCITTVGCATTENHYISYVDHVTDQMQFNVYEDKDERTKHPEHAFRLIEAHWLCNSANGFEQVQKIVNRLVSDWPNSKYVGSSLNRAAWASLFLLESRTNAGGSEYFDEYEENLKNLLRSVTYAEAAGERGSNDFFWLRASARVPVLVRSGVSESIFLLGEYLKTQRSLQIDAINAGGKLYPLINAKKDLQKLKRGDMPRWLIDCVEHDLEQVNEALRDSTKRSGRAPGGIN